MNILVIDTETANTIEQPLPYDVGYAILNTETKEILVKRSFIVAEIFFDKEMMTSAYYAEKIPNYWKDIKSGKREIKVICNIRKQIFEDMKNYNVKRVGAYNMGFDRRATRNDINYITASLIKWFFPYGTEFFCIWNMACSSILNTTDYVAFAYENKLVSNKGNILTSAEAVYKYLIGDVNFSESHTGLEDVEIEIEIFLAVLESGLDYDDRIYSACWQIPQRKRKEMEYEHLFGALVEME